MEQSNGDACGYHSLHNAITIGRALCAASSEAAQGWLDDLCSRRAFEAEMATMQARLRAENRQSLTEIHLCHACSCQEMLTAMQARLRAENRQRVLAGQPAWEVRSIMERSFVAWLLRTHPRIATLVREISVGSGSVCLPKGSR
eukprot:COSAG01_NODE_227_length_21107_cov_85.615099_23_plen_144_part_00